VLFAAPIATRRFELGAVLFVSGLTAFSCCRVGGPAAVRVMAARGNRDRHCER